MNVTLVPHIPEVLYVARSLQWTWRHQPLCCNSHTTVDFSLRLGETCRRQFPGCRWLQTNTGILSVPIPFSQLTVSGRVGRLMCLWHSKPCPASYYLAIVVLRKWYWHRQKTSIHLQPSTTRNFPSTYLTKVQ